MIEQKGSADMNYSPFSDFDSRVPTDIMCASMTVNVPFIVDGIEADIMVICVNKISKKYVCTSEVCISKQL